MDTKQDDALMVLFGLGPEEQAYEQGLVAGMAGYTPRPPVEPHLERAYKMGYVAGQGERAEAEAEAWSLAWTGAD